MYEIRYTNQFKRSLKKCIKRGLDIHILQTALNILQQEGELPNQYRPHKLSGKYYPYWECHLQPDWLLIWDQNDKELTLMFMDTGTHADLFK
ncbi:MAG: type II toxin-antitoxin system YafQ family toxin [Bacteroides sp.]|nr:type II toxin-antitoxin system YafQ family toxin [Bacteroides sp.]